jgi:hypothetical protein
MESHWLLHVERVVKKKKNVEEKKNRYVNSATLHVELHYLWN